MVLLLLVLTLKFTSCCPYTIFLLFCLKSSTIIPQCNIVQSINGKKTNGNVAEDETPVHSGAKKTRGIKGRLFATKGHQETRD